MTQTAGGFVPRSRMYQRLENGEPAIGTVVLTTGTEWIDTLGAVGLDLVCIDLMVTAIDWTEASHMIRAANQFDVTPWIRLQGYPWAGSQEATAHLLADVLRAISIGAEGVCVSIESPEQIAAVLHPAADTHRRVWLGGESWRHEARGEGGTVMVFPFLESLNAIRNIDSILAVEGLPAVFLGLGDISRELGHPGDYDHPDVRSFITSTVAVAKDRGVRVMSTTGFRDTAAEVRDAARWLWEAGVEVIWLPYPSFVVYHAYEQMLQLIRQGTDPAGVESGAAR